MFASSAEAKANGWFSRRHRTGDANHAATVKYQSKARPAARIARRAKRAAKSVTTS